VLQAVPDEARARALVAERASEGPGVTLENLSAQIQAGETKDLNLIIKADFQGSIDAIRNALQRVALANVRANVIHAAAGSVTESDVLLAAASMPSSLVSTRLSRRPARGRAREGRSPLHQIIYGLEDVERPLRGSWSRLPERSPRGAEARQLLASRAATSPVPGCATAHPPRRSRPPPRRPRRPESG
jgi:translation initiation factor IF-2